MEHTKDIVSQIREKYDSFSKSHRKLADYILDNPGDVAFLSINELSQTTGISPATITRFAHKLEFQGYNEFQRGIYEHQKQQAPFGQLKSLLRSEASDDCSEQDSLQNSIQSNIRLLEDLDTPQLRASFLRAQEILRKAGTIYIAGHRSSYAAAYYFAFMLQRMYENVRLIEASSNTLPAVLCDVKSEDCLVIISYARYSSASYDIVSHFHREGCQVIALTDSPTSPIALKSNEVLIAPNGENFSPVGAIALCNCFITSLGRLDAQHTLERMERLDKIALEQRIYL